MAHLEKYYNIQFREGGKWKLLDEIEYTEKEADEQVRSLNMCGSPFAFRKKFLRECMVETLTVRRATA